MRMRVLLVQGVEGKYKRRGREGGREGGRKGGKTTQTMFLNYVTSRQKQVGLHEFYASLVYMVSSRIAKAV